MIIRKHFIFNWYTSHNEAFVWELNRMTCRRWYFRFRFLWTGFNIYWDFKRGRGR